MKKLFLALMVLASLSACKDNPVAKKIKETKQNVKNTKNAVKEMKDVQKDMEELQQMEPLTNAELKEWLPDEINGMKRISFKAGQMGVIQISSIEAVYANEDKSKKFKINVIDGAGPMGASATVGMRMVLSQEFEEEDEYKSRRTTTKKGMKVIEEYRKNNNNSSIEFMQGDRFYIKGSGTNMDLDETWDALEETKPDKLI